MAKLPEIRDRLSVRGAGGTPSYNLAGQTNPYGSANIRIPDTSEIAGAGMAAIGKAIGDVGKDIEAKQELMKKQDEENRQFVEKQQLADAKYRWAMAQIEIENSFVGDNNYGTYTKRYQDGALKAREEAASVIQSATLRRAFYMDTDVDVARGISSMKKAERAGYEKARVSSFNDEIEQAKLKWFEAQDPAIKADIEKSIKAKADGLVYEGIITPQQAKTTLRGIDQFIVSTSLMGMTREQQKLELAPDDSREQLGDRLDVEERIRLLDAIKKEEMAIAEKAIEGYKINASTGRPKDPATAGAMQASLSLGVDISDPQSITGYKKEYIPQVVENQLRSGVREGAVQVIPTDRAQSIVSQINSVTSVEDYVGAIQSLREEFTDEKYFNIALRDLKNTGNLAGDIRTVLEANPEKDGQIINAIFEMRDKDKRKSTMDLADAMLSKNNVPTNQIEKKVTEKMSDYIASNISAFNSNQGINDILKSATDMAKYFYVESGGDETGAVKAATDWIVSRYDFATSAKNGYYAIPKKYTEQYQKSAGSLETIAVYIKHDVINSIEEKRNILLPPGYGGAAGMATYVGELKDGAYWANNEDASGIVLMSPARVPVYFDDGRRVEFRFGNIADYKIPKIKYGSIREGVAPGYTE